jgi:gliding motility-associated-like protein
MKRILPFTFFIFSLQFKGSAQTYVNIPDANFAAYLQSIIPAAMNGNQMDTSSNSVKHLQGINACNLNITSVEGVTYFHSLKQLFINSNLLISLPVLPDSITALQCFGNQLTNLPVLPKSLQLLWCDYNQLISLPDLPNSLTVLLCDNNSLISLPVLPNLLKTLWCGENQLSSLPVLPQTLKTLFCEFNKLTSLPALPDSLTALTCSDNQISCFPIFPNTITSLIIYNNLFTCLPNYLNCMNRKQNSIGAPLINFPLCNINNPNNCPASTDLPTQIIIPNIFTPNGDNINDEFFIKASNLTNFSCKIYNRWGVLVYQFTDINTAWNGKDKSGEAALDGTYFYVISYTDNTNKANTKNGFFQLIK